MAESTLSTGGGASGGRAGDLTAPPPVWQVPLPVPYGLAGRQPGGFPPVGSGPVPLATTLAQINQLGAYLQVELGPPADEGWIQASDFVMAREGALARLLACIGETRGTTDGKIAASFFLHSYVWSLSGVALAAFLLARRVPEMAAEQLAFHFNEEGRAYQLRLLSPCFTCLPDDPAACHPHARVVADEESLRDRLRAQLIAHLTPLIAQLRRYTTLSARAMWLAAADRSASATLWICRQLDCCAEAPREVSALLQVAGSPLCGRTAIVSITCGGQCDWYLRRAGCCLAYKLPAGRHCATCPLLPADEQEQRLREQITA